MKNQEQYKELISEIIKSKIHAFGDLAIRRMSVVTSITVDAAGNVSSLSGDPVEVLRDVLLNFEKVSGPTSTIFAKSVIRKIKQKYPEMELPADLL